MSGLPATLTSGFGILSVSGRMRVPSPGGQDHGAARNDLCRCCGHAIRPSPAARWRDTRPRAAPTPDAPASAADRSIPAGDDASIAACGRAVRVGRKSRGSWMRVARRASHRRARKRAHRRQHRPIGARACIATSSADLHHFRHIHARVLQQRSDVIGGRPHHRILEVEQADASRALALGQPEKIGRMDIAQHPGLRARSSSAATRRARACDRFRAWRRKFWFRAWADTSRAAIPPRSEMRPCRRGGSR